MTTLLQYINNINQYKQNKNKIFLGDNDPDIPVNW